MPLYACENQHLHFHTHTHTHTHIQAVKSSELIGFYVLPEVWCRLVLPAVRTSAGCRVSGTDQSSTVAVGPVQCTSCLTVLTAFIRGASGEHVLPHLQVGGAGGGSQYRSTYNYTVECTTLVLLILEAHIHVHYRINLLGDTV